METGLFEIQGKHLREYRQNRQLLLDTGGGIHALSQPDSVGAHASARTNGPAAEFARCFLRLANLPNFALDRLSRYEATIWRQASQILYVLEMLDRRKPQERTAHYLSGMRLASDRCMPNPKKPSTLKVDGPMAL